MRIRIEIQSIQHLFGIDHRRHKCNESKIVQLRTSKIEKIFSAHNDQIRVA